MATKNQLLENEARLLETIRRLQEINNQADQTIHLLNEQTKEAQHRAAKHRVEINEQQKELDRLRPPTPDQSTLDKMALLAGEKFALGQRVAELEERVSEQADLIKALRKDLENAKGAVEINDQEMTLAVIGTIRFNPHARALAEQALKQVTESEAVSE